MKKIKFLIKLDLKKWLFVYLISNLYFNTYLDPEYNGTVISKEEMGNAAWKLLHLMSIHISDVPTKE